MSITMIIFLVLLVFWAIIILGVLWFVGWNMVEEVIRQFFREDKNGKHT